MLNKCIIAFFSLIALSCEVNNGDDDIPSYLYIPELELNVSNPNTTGRSGSNITDAWVFADEKFIGAFQLPAEVPILTKGATNIRIGAGIKVNGISATRAIFPFYSDYQTTVELRPELTDTIFPAVDYDQGVSMPWIEEFEDSSFSMDTISSSNTELSRVPYNFDPITYGGFIARVEMTEVNPGFKAITNEEYFLPQNGAPLYLEMDYRSNVQLVVSLIIQPGDGSPRREEAVIFLNPTNPLDASTWNHLYLNITDPVNFQFDATNFGVGLTAAYASSKDSSVVYFDNLKLVRR